jgi:DNA replication protein DnaC
MAEALEAWHATPANADRGQDELLAYLLDAHRQALTQGRSEGFFRRAGLATHFSLATFTSGQATGLLPQRMDHLKGLSWIPRGQCVVITGPARSGKTHLAAGLGQEAMVQGVRTLFVQTPRLLERCLDIEEPSASRKRYLKQLGTIPLLVMDDFATEHASTERTYLLRRLLDDRNRKGLPTVVASINDVGDWDDYFEDAAAREGIYARVLDQCHRVELKRRPPAAAHPKAGRSSSHKTRAKVTAVKEAASS